MPDLAEQARRLLGIELSLKQIRQFDQLLDLLQDWNQRFNLTGIKEADAIVIKHFLDSLTIWKALPATKRASLIDVGSGAGFPGLPLAIVRPELQLTLLDSTAKKLRFVDHAGAALGLTHIRTLHARAEDAGQDKRHRENYAVAVARAVAPLPSLLEYSLPFVSPGGSFIAMLGASARKDVKAAAAAARLLGGELRAIETVHLPTLDHPRHVAVYRKVRKTPRRFPRRAGIPKREPLQ